ncbi:hypothetical protein D7X33_19385 [Butyricicoccus sp. 1XD8-22]|nr:hypothetical protein D7X33_19385 [Butyricicoccus sp. 1XD8-22]
MQIGNPNEQQNETQSPSLGKKVAKQAGKKLAREALKKLGKKAMGAAAKGVIAALKALVVAAISVCLPFLGIIALLFLGLFIIYMCVTLLFSFGGDSLDEEAAKQRDYLMEVAANTVDQSDSVQSQYALPYELLVATLQILDTEKDTGFSTFDVDNIATALAPEFYYETVELKKQTKKKSCKKDGGCSWKTTTKTFEAQVIDYVITWDSYIEYDHEVKWSSWDKVSDSKKVREQYTIPIVESTKMDYSKFDEAMSIEPLEYSQNDKYMVEALYAITEKPIQYREWKEGSSHFDGGNFDGSILPGSSIPSEYFPIYLAAQEKYGVSWNYVAAIHYVETKFSTIDPMLSSAGAEGHTQIMPCTLHGWSYPGCDGSMGYVEIPENLKYKVSTIEQYGGLGVDANNDGMASPWDIEDALYTTASMLKRAEFDIDNPEKAIFSYNHSQIYVNDVMKYAQQFADEASYLINDGVPNSAGFIQPTAGNVTSPFGWRFGGTDWHQGVDIGNAMGTPIVAVADGVVTKVISSCAQSGPCAATTYGNYVRVKHNINGHAYETLYAHLMTTQVSVNQTVKQGQVVGLMGNSGNSSGPHLHFEIHNGNWTWPPDNAINPAFLVPLP